MSPSRANRDHPCLRPLAGQASSNVFDGNRDLDGSKLRGVARRCKLGLLTLFEWYKYVEVSSGERMQRRGGYVFHHSTTLAERSCERRIRPSSLILLPRSFHRRQVGSHLKTPELPFWVVCYESHFTVLFGADARPMTSPPPFDLLFYDELANQEVRG